jgi:GNAT superfamily N-acetyltransferase
MWTAIQTLEDLQQNLVSEGIPALSPAQFALTQPDAHWQWMQAGQLRGRYSLWIKANWDNPSKKSGLIGHVMATDRAIAHSLMLHACNQLRNMGCTEAIAPIDGNTWHPYRWVVETGIEPPFFLEPQNPDWIVEVAQDLGFSPIATYQSRLNTDLTQRDPSVPAVRSRLTQAGITLRPFAAERIEQELQAIYELSLLSFRQNFLYEAIAPAQFLTQYQALLPYLKSDLVLMAEVDQALVGFAFALPDWNQAQRSETIDTVILKTVAVHPARRYAGLGRWLVDEIQAIAHSLGYRRAIHALMQDDNRSKNLSQRHSTQWLRRYALLGRSL